MTPAYLERTLSEFKRQKGYLPKMLAGHINPPYKGEIRGEVKHLAEADMMMSLPGPPKVYTLS